MIDQALCITNNKFNNLPMRLILSHNKLRFSSGFINADPHLTIGILPLWVIATTATSDEVKVSVF